LPYAVETRTEGWRFLVNIERVAGREKCESAGSDPPNMVLHAFPDLCAVSLVNGR